MKTIAARFVPRHSPRPRVEISDSYVARCPYCREHNLAWPSEMTKPSGTNKCRHFDGITKAQAFRFRKKPVIVHVERISTVINGVSFPYPLKRLHPLLEWLESEGPQHCDSALAPLVPLLCRCYALSHSYHGLGFNDRFAAIRLEVARLAKTL